MGHMWAPKDSPTAGATRYGHGLTRRRDGRTHTIVSLETRIRRKDGTEISGFRVCVGWISTTRVCVVGLHVLD